jgi:hypothetical protein
MKDTRAGVSAEDRKEFKCLRTMRETTIIIESKIMLIKIRQGRDKSDKLVSKTQDKSGRLQIIIRLT